MKWFVISCLAFAVFVLTPPVSAGADSGEPAVAVSVRPPVRTVVPPRPDPTLPNEGITWELSASAAAAEPAVAEVSPDLPLPRITVSPPEAGEVSIRVVITVNGKEHVIELPSVTVGAMVRALAAPVPTPVAPAPLPVSLTPAASAPVFAERSPAVITPRMPALDGPGVYRVQVGSFARTALAQRCFDRLRSAGFEAAAFERFDGMYRVVIPGVRAAEMAEVARRLGNAGFPEAWARREN